MKHRAEAAVRLVRERGWRELAQRGARTLYRRLQAETLDFPLLTSDVADSRTTRLAEAVPPLPHGTPLRVAWVSTPPGPGSGGHTTMFRMVTALERAGHVCTIYLYDRYGGSLERHTEVIRRGWPDVQAEVRDIGDGLEGADLAVATSWPTAHVLASRAKSALRPTYFIQDFEPYFAPHGSEYELALDTYRMGFDCIALGRMVHDRLASIGTASTVVDFGCDTSTYHLTGASSERRGVVFYARPGVGRRGFELGIMALDQFHAQHPDEPIHIYGSDVGQLGFPVQRHGSLTPAALNDLYNSVVAGLAMSFTNISLVAEEMLAAGAIPVVNDSPDSRADLDNPFAEWTPPTPSGFAERLGALVTSPDVSGRARRAAESVRQRSWSGSGAQLVAAVETIAYGSSGRHDVPDQLTEASR